MPNTMPDIRFAGFTGPWERRKFSEVFSFLRNNTLSRAELSESDGHTLNVHYGDVLIKFGEVLDVSRDTLPRIADDSLADRLSCQALADGDVIIADTAEDEAVGKCSELRGCGDARIVSGLHTMACRSLFEFAPGYLGYYLNSPAYHSQLLPLMQGIKVISVPKSAIEDTMVSFPSFAEQSAIGTSLSELENLITLHQRKCDQLAVLKKALLNKMFPRDGKNMPELRFAGFTGPWEQRKLGELAEITGGLTKNPERRTMPKQLPYLRVANVEAGRINLDELLSIGVTEEEATKLSLQLDDLLFVEGNGAKSQIGRVAVWKGQVNHCVHQNHLIRARCYQTVPSFVAQYYSTPYGRIEIEGKAFTSSGLYSLSVEKIKDLAILVPSEIEQRDIGLLLEGLDNLITLHQRKLEVLRNLKSALLDKMFV